VKPVSVTASSNGIPGLFLNDFAGPGEGAFFLFADLFFFDRRTQWCAEGGINHRFVRMVRDSAFAVVQDNWLVSVLANIRWLKPYEGGRTAPPPGPSYSTVAKFETQTTEEWRKQAWSIVVDLDGTPDETWTQTARISFLADETEAPVNWLSPRTAFELFEGLSKVADGIVLEAVLPVLDGEDLSSPSGSGSEPFPLCIRDRQPPVQRGRRHDV
jgi:hypothetical protein